MATSNRFPYETSNVLNQAFLDESADNLTNQLELIVDIDSPIGTLHLSDRNKYVGDTFYEARLNFPIISRTVGEFLNPQLEFSQLQLEINNTDGKFNSIMPSGNDFNGWIGRSVSVSIGLRDVASTYTEVFKGRVTDQGGFQRSVRSFTLIARNDFERINKNFPRAVFSSAVYPDLEPEFENTVVPVIYGDWTQNVEPGSASVPAIVVNGLDPNVNGETGFTTNIRMVISANANTTFQTTEVYLDRGEIFHNMAAADIVNVSADKNAFEIRQINTAPVGVTLIEGEPYQFERGDKFYVKVIGKDLGSHTNNLVWQARDILIEYGDLTSGDFDLNWAMFRDRNLPASDAIAGTLSRVWVQEPVPVLEYVLSMLSQVRLEAFIDRNLKLKINSLHFQDFVPNPSFVVKNWDLEVDSFQPTIDDRNNFNRVRGSYNFLPNRNENFQETPVFRNNAAIAQAGNEISKRIVFPNLYGPANVVLQVVEYLKLASAYFETINATITWRGSLLDIGQFVKLNVNIQSTEFDGVPAMIREIGYDPDGIKIPIKVWSFQLVPFPGYNPGYSGIVGGNTATITEE